MPVTNSVSSVLFNLNISLDMIKTNTLTHGVTGFKARARCKVMLISSYSSLIRTQPCGHCLRKAATEQDERIFLSSASKVCAKFLSNMAGRVEDFPL